MKAFSHIPHVVWCARLCPVGIDFSHLKSLPSKLTGNFSKLYFTLESACSSAICLKFRGAVQFWSLIILFHIQNIILSGFMSKVHQKCFFTWFFKYKISDSSPPTPALIQIFLMKWGILMVENNVTFLSFFKHLSHFPLGKNKTAGEIRISKWKKKLLK